MKLNVFERLLLRNIVPQLERWNFDSMKAARVLLENLFTEEEGEKLQISPNEDGKGVTWKVKDEEGNDIPQEKEVKVSGGLKKKISAFLEDLDKKEMLEFQHYSLYEKFVGE